MKFCINCEYIDHKKRSCYREPGHFNLVLGESKIITKDCYAERSFPFPFDILFFKCGRRGRYFVEKTNLDLYSNAFPKDEGINNE